MIVVGCGRERCDGCSHKRKTVLDRGGQFIDVGAELTLFSSFWELTKSSESCPLCALISLTLVDPFSFVPNDGRQSNQHFYRLMPNILVASCLIILTSRSQKVRVFSDLFRPCITKVSELNTMLFNNYIKICVRYYRNVYKRS